MRSTIDLLLDDLVNGQRGLTRALVKQDQESRRVQLPRRDKAAKAIADYVGGLETERRRLAEECHRLGNEVMQIRYVVQLLRETAAQVVSEAEARASAVVRAPDPTLRSFSAVLMDAITAGHAKRLNGDVVITYAGLLELAKAAQTRETLDELRTEHFELGRKCRELEQRTNADAQAKAVS